MKQQRRFYPYVGIPASAPSEIAEADDEPTLEDYARLDLSAPLSSRDHSLRVAGLALAWRRAQ